VIDMLGVAGYFTTVVDDHERRAFTAAGDDPLPRWFRTRCEPVIEYCCG